MSESSAPLTWSHFNPVKVVVEAGALGHLQTFVPIEGKVLLVTTAGFSRRGLTARIIEMLGADRVLVYDQVTPNPEVDDLDDANIQFKSCQIRCVIALGGGSVMDTAKIIGVTLPSNLDRPLAQIFRNNLKNTWISRLPVVCIPTTSGTGAEVTPFATAWDSKDQKKYSVTGVEVYPTYALLDPELTLSLPKDDTLYTSLDAISHGLESLWNRNRTSLSSAFSMQALSLAVEALPVILSQPENLEKRGQMQQASMLAGMAISQTRTAIAHSISYPLTIHFGVPHGLACSFTLRELLKNNMDEIVTQPHERLVLVAVLNLLESLNLGEKIRGYLSAETIMDLQAEMETKGRADNFIGKMSHGLEELLNSSLN
ncbi:phosphonoacetaldehyde reductase [Candidatus Peregrinibacteria bacterium]|jgi:alcohol dehydrogenase|nr:phosphonoacetaldehyde reductase [Candidatus Peregrinibacteria bacterium]